MATILGDKAGRDAAGYVVAAIPTELAMVAGRDGLAYVFAFHVGLDATSILSFLTTRPSWRSVMDT